MVFWRTVVSFWAWSTETFSALIPEPWSLAWRVNSRLAPVAVRSGESHASGAAMSRVKR